MEGGACPEGDVGGGVGGSAAGVCGYAGRRDGRVMADVLLERQQAEWRDARPDRVSTARHSSSPGTPWNTCSNSRRRSPHDESARQAWLDEWCHPLKHEGDRGAGACGGAPTRHAARTRAPSASSAGDVLPQPRAPHGLSGVCRQRLANRLRPRGVGLQNGRRQSPPRGRHALGPRRRQRRLPPPRHLPSAIPPAGTPSRRQAA